MPDVAELQHQRQRWQRIQNAAVLIPSIIFIVVSACALPVAMQQTTQGWEGVRPWIAAALIIGLIGTNCIFCQRHMAMRREAGYSTACFDCVEFGEAVDPWNPHALAHLHEVQNMPDAASMRKELKMLKALQEIRERPWEGHGDGGAPLECSLCMELVEEGMRIKQLPCQHAFHAKCIDRWLFHAQRGQRRRCPLCNVDPVPLQEVIVVAGVSTPPESSTLTEDSPSFTRSPSSPHESAAAASSPASPSVWAERRRWAWQVVVGEPSSPPRAPATPHQGEPTAAARGPAPPTTTTPPRRVAPVAPAASALSPLRSV